MELGLRIGNYNLQFGRHKNVPQRESLSQGLINALVNMFNHFANKQRTSKKLNEKALRQFANTAIPRRAINMIKDAILGLPWAVVNYDDNDKNEYSELKSVLSNIVSNPNDDETFEEFWGAIVEDILVGDCGCAEIVKAGNQERPFYLYSTDGFTMEHVYEWFDDKTAPRFAQKNPFTGKYTLFNSDQILYIKKNNFSHTPHGLSPLEAAFDYINYLLNTQAYCDMVTSKAMPKFILNLGETLDETKIKEFQKYFHEDVYGSGELPIIGGSKGISSHQIGAINDDNLYLSWQHFLITVIAFSFGVDPKKLGEGSATDRSTIEEQNQNVINEAVKPIAKLIAGAINKRIIGRMGYGKKVKFTFVFEETEAQKKVKIGNVVDQYTNDLITRNEGRKLLGQSKSDDEYGDMYYSEYKAAVNMEYTPVVDKGGFNGVGQDNYDGKPTKNAKKEDG